MIYFFKVRLDLFFNFLEVVSSVANHVESSSGNEKAKEDAPPKEKEVVDLTISDSDDDEPLAKRRAINPKPDSTNKFSGMLVQYLID